MVFSKRDIRARYLRNQPVEVESVGIMTQLEAYLNDINPNIVGCYVAAGHECDLTNFMQKSPYPIALPVCKANSLHFSSWKFGEPLQRGAHHMYEPDIKKNVEPSVIIVPCVALTKAGERLGRGGGYYDKYIKRQRMKNSSFTTIALAYSNQFCDELPIEEHDQHLDIIITHDKLEILHHGV